MKIIPAQVTGRYADRVFTLSRAAGERYVQLVGQIADAWSQDAQLPIVDQLLEFASQLEELYGDAAGAVASDLYLEIAELYGILLNSVPIAKQMSPEALRGRLEAAVADNVSEGVLDKVGLQKACRALMESNVKRRANDTVRQQSVRDRSRNGSFARVPQGNETCAFCLLLASNGFMYSTKENAELNGHEHDNCDCLIIPAFGEGAIEGYTDEVLPKYKKLYKDYEGHGAGDRTNESVNNMRKALYEGAEGFPGYKDRRNRLRRENYARKKALADLNK